MNISLGTWFNVPVTIHWSTLVFYLFLSFLSQQYILVFPLLFLIVLLHEFGHIIAAQKCGMETYSIILTPLGGLASIDMSRITPKKELITTLAGPAVNLFLAPFLYGVAFFFDTSTFIGNSAWLIAHLNLLMLFFNIIPAFPLDGGRILRSLLAFKFNFVKSTRWAVMVSKVFAVLFFLAIFTGQFMLAAIAVFIWIAGDQELKQVESTIHYQDSSNTRNKLAELEDRVRNALRQNN